ncbi:hypothetical protein SLEP1_g34643 [Rubroshorea leprosula]|uniref:Uncharacterized protein n=1 Tax=Rubroshorea leprosula TaxID=152421 RepID=A0AAV5KKM6_9ROSI|nr:hypothetical protein SLEP1_g34643 [Rubroshorea leprosula]
MASDSPPDSPSPSMDKRLKTLAMGSESIIQVQPDLRRQESKEEQPSMEESDSDSCGICLSEGARLIRGIIDSCDHFFCFVCIMEWSKVESRCPMCKRRFSTILRPPKVGVFTSERVVNVPHRDQAHHPYGNVTGGTFDPYARVQCSVCQNAANEHLLLLCDLCDTASHTYCIGLGATVPEGDWFCHDCAISRAEHDKNELDTGIDNHNITGNSYVKLYPEKDVSIFDVVRESNIRAIESNNSSFSPPSNCCSCTVDSGREINVSVEVTCPSERSTQSIVGKVTESGARTLRICRNVHGRIQSLRENWHALQSGSASFSSSLAESSSRRSQKGKVSPMFHVKSRESESSSSTSLQSTAQDSFPSNTMPQRDLYDVNRAWEMLDIAQSMQKNSEKARSSNGVPKVPLSMGKSSKEVIGTSSGVNLLKGKQFETKNLVSRQEVKHHEHNLFERQVQKQKSPKLELQQQSIDMDKGPNKRLPTNSLGLCESALPKRVRCQGDISNASARPFVKNAHETSSSITKEQVVPSCSTSVVGSVPVRSTDLLDAKVDFTSSASSKLGIPERKVRVSNTYAKNQDGRADNAKSEIQSLVKLNLKLMSQDKKLGVDTFKEVARLATHSILAACGLEHSKSRARTFPSCECNHTEEIKRINQSTLMPNSCQDCFNVFVRNVVRTIMFEKVGPKRSIDHVNVS